jgi:hypothetical protein
MNKKTKFLIIAALAAIFCHWYFGTKVFTRFSYPIFSKQHWYAEVLKTWIQEEDPNRLRIWKDTIPVFMNERDVKLPKVKGFAIISLSPRSALWNEYRNRRFCQIIQENGRFLSGRKITVRVRDNFNADTSKFNFTNIPIAMPRDWNFVLFGIRYTWIIQEYARPTRKKG